MGVLRDHPEPALFLRLAAGYLLGKLRVGPITLGGFLAGAATESAVVGTATGAIAELPDLTAEQITTYQGHVATAYTVCHLFGLVTIVIHTSQVMPMLLRVNLRDASRELWERMRGGGVSLESDEREALPGLVGRTYPVTTADGRTVGDLEAGFGGRVTVEAVKRGSRTLTPHRTSRSPSRTWS